jgi:hypothetical protein
MPPFEYRTPVNPFAGSVGDLLEHSGDASAFAAHAIGQTVAALPELMQQQRRTALVDEAGRRQLDEAKRKDLEESRARSIQGAMDVVLKGSLVKDPATGLTTYDREKLQAGMTEVGVPQTALAQYLPVLDASDKAIAQAKALHVEALKHSAQLVDMAGNDPAVFKAEIQRGIANGLFTAQDAQPYLVAAEQDPTHIGRITAAMLGRDPHAGEFTLNPGDRRFDANGRELATNPKPADTPSMQSKDVLLDGKPALVSFNPKTGTYHDATGADVTPRVRPMPPASVQVHNLGSPTFVGDFEKTGDAFLQTIPAQWRTTVKKIASYDEDPTRVASMRGGNREQLMAWVNQVNPAYDQSSFAIRNPTRKAFTTGTQGQQVTAINTAVEHLDLLQQAADALKNGSFVPGNALYNTVRRTFGSAAPSNYATIKEMVDHEVGAVASKGVPTVNDVASQGKLGSASSSPEAIKGYIDTLIPLMGSKLNALHYQYQQAMGADDPWKPLTPQTEAILQRRGVSMGPQSEQTVTQTVKEGATQPIPGIPNSEATFKNGKWVRTK